MALLDLIDHLLNFIAPAFAVGFLCALLGRLAMRKAAGTPAWWTQGAINFIVGIVVLAAGLIVFGHDGRMLTYGALVAACGTSQWLVAGGWRR
ncbi:MULTISPECIES: hypothetical protein [unclassified Variovorax]|uniref:hypothetical protein n=1 Tax=unclassified Variovorax TaxID=663243 RepID=UPI001316EEC9|nr:MULTISPECIES: hypothetical protein [unclassified Variovorax]VTU14665.1 hypothetical protein SRS16CHR_01209 [Variovorax sp. SRS16]VTU21427.1 hypothetical protein E5CHR_01185 [Variovorax sp. PBL-E5]